MRSSPLAYLLFALSILAWGGFGYLVMFLHADRASYADAAIIAADTSEREESAARLRATIQGTEVERAALESVISVSIVDAAEIIEGAVKSAGASDVKITEATAQKTSPQKLSTVAIGVNASGSFVSLVRAASLLEALPVPATIDRVEIAKNDKQWRLTARLTVTLAAQK